VSVTILPEIVAGPLLTERVTGRPEEAVGAVTEKGDSARGLEEIVEKADIVWEAAITLDEIPGYAERECP
jgi:hypothetical protein